LAFALLAILPAGASCEPARSAPDVAAALGAAQLRGDHEAAASFLTAETRQLFLDLKQSEARLRKARTDLDAAIGARFALADRDRMIRPSSTEPVDRVEAVGHRVTGAITADVDIS
jgi:phosphomannomutase